MERIDTPLLSLPDLDHEEICVKSSIKRAAGFRIENSSEIYRRALSIATQREHTAHIFLKAPFLFQAKLLGLWPGCRIPTCFMAAVGVLLNIYIMTGNIFAFQICNMLHNSTANELSPWLCYGTSKIAKVNKVWAVVFRPVLLSQIVFHCSEFCGYALMLLVRRGLSEEKHAIPLDKACAILTKKQWLHLNVQILVFVLVWVGFYGSYQYIEENYYLHGKRTVFIEIQNASFWLYIGTPCWIFAVITSALESLVDACFDEIKESHGDIDDVIQIYNQLCKHVFSTCRVTKVWFVLHWFCCGAVFVVDTAIGLNFFIHRHNPGIFWVFGCCAYFGSIYAFLYPCICAACLTSKCGELLERLNTLEPQDWHDQHPLRRRPKMNDFLIFANQMQCGFKVGQLKFDDVLAWMSLLVELLGIAVKLLETSTDLSV